MNKEKIDKLMAWLKQPSTIKAIILFAGLAGTTLEPDKMQEIVTAATVFYGAIAMFYDKN
jgi:hypothetical protein